MGILGVLVVALGVGLVVLFQELGKVRAEVQVLARDLQALRQGAAPAGVVADVQPAHEPAAPSPVPPAEATLSPEPGPSLGEPAAVLASAAPAPAAQAPRPAAPAPPVPPPGRVRPPLTGAAVSTWLSENGLAWIGGGALALGGLLLVAYAAQRGVFTPGLRILAAIVLGFLMLAAGEWIRRRPDQPGRRHGLAAAMASAAGAATLYGAVWAAFALYGFIPGGLAGGLLAAISLGLLALALLHGEPLALLALVAAFLVPLVVNSPTASTWSAAAYLLLVGGTGAVVTFWRRWGRAGALTLGASALWVLLISSASDSAPGAVLLVGVTAAVVLAASWRRPCSEAGSLRLLPTAALVGGWALWAAIWCVIATSRPPLVPAGVALAALFAFAALRDLVGGRLMWAPAGAVVLAALALLPVWERAEANASLLLLAPLAAVSASALLVALRTTWRRDAAIAGAVGAAIALTLLQGPLAGVTPAPALVFLLAAGLLLVGAVPLARRSPDPQSDLGLAAWAGAAAEVAGLAIHAAAPDRLEPAAFAAFAAVLALAAARLPWRGLPEAAALAALVALARLLGPEVAGRALSSQADWPEIVLLTFGAVVGQVAAWAVLRRGARSPGSQEAVSTTAVLSALLGAFLALRLLAAPHDPAAARMDVFAEAALRTVLLLAAGLVLSLRGSASVFGRVRGGVLIGAGVLHGVVVNGLVLNPLLFGPPVVGPPLLDTLALGFLAPALILLAAAGRLRASRSWAGAAGAGAVLFGLLWAGTEIRRLFHGAQLGLQTGAFYSEVAAYGVALLVLLAAVLFSRRRPAGRSVEQGAAEGEPHALGDLTQAFTWCVLLLSTGLLAGVSSPWWGSLTGPFKAPGLLFALWAAAAGVTWLVRRLIGGRAGGGVAEGAVICTVVQLLALLTMLIRFGFHGADVRAELAEASLETWSFSAAWAAFGLGVMTVGVRSRDPALRWLGLAVLGVVTLKVLLFDLSRLSGVIRAGSFLALGALLLVGALASRRLGGGRGKVTQDDRPPAEPATEPES